MDTRVFISYSSRDRDAATAICAALESAGMPCWIAPRDIVPGKDWGEAIVETLNACRVMVLVFSANANQSVKVRRKAQYAFDMGVAVLPVRIEDVRPEKGAPLLPQQRPLVRSHWANRAAPGGTDRGRHKSARRSGWRWGPNAFGAETRRFGINRAGPCRAGRRPLGLRDAFSRAPPTTHRLDRHGGRRCGPPSLRGVSGIMAPRPPVRRRCGFNVAWPYLDSSMDRAAPGRPGEPGGHGARFAATDPAAEEYVRTGVQYTLQRGRLGIAPQQAGLYVSSVPPGSAGTAGLRTGDLLLTYGGKPATDAQTLADWVKQTGAVESVQIEFLHWDRTGCFSIQSAQVEQTRVISAVFRPI